VAVSRFAVIFDFDGTILDSESAEYESHRRFFADHGVDLTVDEWCIGIGIVKPATHWFDWFSERAGSPPTFDDFRRVTRRYFREHVRMEPMPGISTLIGGLIASGVPIAIASSASADWVVGAVERLGLRDTFAAIVTGEQVAMTKPAPDGYLEAARRLGVAPGSCVAIEDSGPGVAAARAAGMHTVAVPHRLNLTHDFAPADLRVESAAELSVERLAALVGRAASRSSPSIEPDPR
jgi:HAD superfamily hydrolase (TIGR01509 family)